MVEVVSRDRIKSKRFLFSGGTLLHVGQTPKTEYLWFDTWADDEAGKRIVEMRMMLRFMKASSDKYSDAAAGAPAETPAGAASV